MYHLDPHFFYLKLVAVYTNKTILSDCPFTRNLSPSKFSILTPQWNAQLRV